MVQILRAYRAPLLIAAVIFLAAAVTKINLKEQSIPPGSNGQLLFNNNGFTDAEDPVVSQPTASLLNATVTQGPAAAANAPWSMELSDGAAFYTGAKTGQFPSALDGSGFFKVHEQGTATVTGAGGTFPVTCSNCSGTVTVSVSGNPADNLAQVGGNAVTTTDSGTQGVAPQATASSTGALVACNILSAASTNSTNCKNAAGNFYGYEIFNTTTTVYYLRLYNASSAPTCSSATGFIRSIPIPPAAASGQVGGAISNQIEGVNYGTGIGFCITGGSSSTDNTNAATGIFGEIRYK